MYLPSSLWTWSFLLITVVQGLAVVGLEIYALVVFERSLYPQAFDESVPAPNPTIPGVEPPLRFVYTRTIPTFLTLYIFAVVYQIILTIDALRMKNIIQVIGLCILNVLLMAYGILQTTQVQNAIQQLFGVINSATITNLTPVSDAVPSILGAGSLILALVSWKLYQEFAWTIYKSISADLRMKRRYLTYQVYIALLKFDFFFFLGYTISFLVVLQTTGFDAEFPLTIAAIPITIIILLLAAFFVRRESMAGTVFVMLFYFAGMAYFLFKLVRIWVGDKRKYYQAIAKPLTTFAAIDVALLVVTIGVCIATALNFNKGLKEHLLGDTSGRRKTELDESKIYPPNEMGNLAYHHGGAPMPSRMTIE